MTTTETFTHKENSFRATRDGTHIYYQSWTKPDAKKLLVIQHGFGEHSGRYGNIVQRFSGESVSIYALDARGHGNSEGKRGHVEQFQYYIDDLADLIHIAREKEKKEKIILLGHSLGGVIALQYTLELNNQDYMHALIVSSPGLKVKMDLEKEVKKVASQYLAIFFPDFTVDANLDLKFLTRDTSVIKAYQNDKLTHGKISFQMANNLFYLSRAIYHKVHNIKIPVYLFHGEADGIADIRGSRELFAKMTGDNKTFKSYPGLYHELMNELPKDRERVLDGIVEFLATTPEE
ncbi:MAG: lysophospholipase [Spirochaetota bacterium]